MTIPKTVDRETMIRMAQAAMEQDATVSGITLLLPNENGRLDEVYIAKRPSPPRRQ